MMLTKDTCHKIFNFFNDQKILVIGDVMVDSYLWGKVDRISPEAPVPVVAVKKTVPFFHFPRAGSSVRSFLHRVSH